MLFEFRNSMMLLKRLYDQMMEPVCSQYDITRMELDILLFLANNPSYDTATDIIGRRGLTKSHVSVSIRLLEEKGYLEKRYLDGNRKTAHLVLLPPSVPSVSAGQKAQADFSAVIFRGFSDQEYQQMEEGISKLADNIRMAFQEESL